MTVLHPSQRAAVKAATRHAMDALPAIGETQRQAAGRVLGVGPDRVSRWCADHVDELIPLASALVLERESQMPVFAALFAAATGHRLVPIAGGEAPAADLIGGLCRLVGSHGAAVAVISEALADGRATAREAGDGLAALAQVESDIVELKRRLTAIRAGEVG